jgi:predicted nucleic acid-binding protein
VIVLDASAVVDVVLDQPSKGWVLEQLRGTPVLAPGHQPAEVLSAVARLVRAGTLAPAVADEALAEAAGLRQELVPSTADHLSRALGLQTRIRVLDALYVALAEERGAALVTTDARLARAQLPVRVLAPESS